MEAHDLGPLLHGPPGQCLDPGKIVRLVVIAMLELGGGDSDVSHWHGPLEARAAG